jgi:hypothetical protein
MVLLAAPLAACDKGTERVMRGEGVLTEAAVDRSVHEQGASERGSEKPSLLDPAPLAEALHELEAATTTPIAALELVISPTAVILQAQDRTRPSEVVQYEYRGGKLDASRRVELRGSGDLDDNLFPLAEVNLEAIPHLAKQAVASVDPQNGQVMRVVVRRNLPFDDAIGVRVYVDSPRKAGHLDADHTGRPLNGLEAP